jgi:hypothetical protein
MAIWLKARSGRKKGKINKSKRYCLHEEQPDYFATQWFGKHNVFTFFWSNSNVFVRAIVLGFNNCLLA